MDQIADLLTRIKNATLVNKKSLAVPHSKIKEAILNILKDQGFIKGFEVSNVEEKKTIEIMLVGSSNTLSHLKRISKPGRRVYVKGKDIPKPLRGLGLVIVSTPQGVFTGWEAAKKGIGGELICEVW